MNGRIFSDGVTPDGTPQNVVVTFHLGLTVTFYIIAAVGIVFTFVCLFFNVKYRNTRYNAWCIHRENSIFLCMTELLFTMKTVSICECLCDMSAGWTACSLLPIVSSVNFSSHYSRLVAIGYHYTCILQPLYRHTFRLFVMITTSVSL